MSQLAHAAARSAFSVFLIAACTAPPRPVEAQPIPAPPVLVQIGIAGELSAAELDAAVVQPLEAALADLRDVQGLLARSDDGRADLFVTLAAPAAIEAVRDAVDAARRGLPAALEAPVLTRLDGVHPALTVAVDRSAADSFRRALEQVPGVSRVDVCRGREPRLTVALDRARLDRTPVDRLLDAVTAALALPADDRVERLASLPLDGDVRLGDVARLQFGLAPPTCVAYDRRAEVVLLTVFAQAGADPHRVAADARLAAPELAADSVPAAGLDLTVLALELSPAGPPDRALELAPADAPDRALAPADPPDRALATCLAASPSLPAWALTFPEFAAAEPVVRARLYLGREQSAPLSPVLEDISRCPGVQRLAVLAPAAHADHGLGLRLYGPDPAVLADLADRAAASLAGLDGVTAIQVRADRERPPVAAVRRDVLERHNIPLATATQAVQLARGRITLAAPGSGDPVDLDLTDRTGPLDQLLGELQLGAPVPVGLAELVHMQPPARAPRYRVDRQPAALVELRLRRASDREAVQRALHQQLDLPAGVRLELGPELPPLDP